MTVTDPAGKTKTFTMDAFSNLTKVQEPDPTLGTVTTNYTYDILNHLTQVSMPRGANTQTRTFVYNVGNTVGTDLLSATNPENGTVTYTYNSDHKLNTKTDAKNQQFTYQYDGYKRVTQISVGGNALRTFMYDSNTLDGQFSQYSQGRLVAVQHSAFYPGTVNAIQFTEMYSYTQPGQATKRRLQVTETLPYGQGLTIPRTLNLDVTQTYDTEGKMTSVNYPTTYGLNGAATTGPTYSYQFDAMSRPNVLTDQNSATIANNVQYGPANELHHISYGGVSETRSYNAMLQMTGLSIPGQLNITYNFSGNTNNGKITSQTDNLSGETISYQYDSLNRLLSASASGWNQTFGYDGFGSLVSKTGTNAPVLSIAVNPATNQIVGQPYDANGNQLTGGLGYDPENRLQTAPGVQYAYDSKNKRIWRGTFDGNGNLTAQEAYFYGVGGQKLGTYALTVVQQNNQQPQLTDSNTDSAVFFGGKRVLSGGGAFIQDRLGSARRSQSGAAMSFYAYGEDKGTTQPNDQLKFATYTRDSATGLDYADHRYYANNFGRFMSSDPYLASGGTSDPGSWNRYTYVGGDPVNLMDRRGLNSYSPELDDPGSQHCGPDWIWDPFLTGPCEDSGGGGGGGGGDDGGDSFVSPTTQAEKRARDDLAKVKCYGLLGFASAAAAQSWFDRTIAPYFHEDSYGKLHMLAPGIPAGRPYPAPANTVGAGQININTDYNWADFSKVTTDTGRTENYLGDLNAAYHTNMTSDQLGTLIIIHELGHQITAPKQPSNVEDDAEKIKIYNDCVK